jgi:hypothetical protein
MLLISSLLKHAVSPGRGHQYFGKSEDDCLILFVHAKVSPASGRLAKSAAAAWDGTLQSSTGVFRRGMNAAFRPHVGLIIATRFHGLTCAATSSRSRLPLTCINVSPKSGSMPMLARQGK